MLIEFKFPREPNEQNAAWTMALGEVLKDFYRLAAFPGRAERLFVCVETARLRRYMTGAAQRYGITIHAEQVVLRPADAVRLPSTAAQIIGAELAAHHVDARRITLLDVDDELRLAVYEVDPLGASPDPAVGRLAAADTSDDSALVVQLAGEVPPWVVEELGPLSRSSVSSRVMPAGSRDGVRQEILAAIRALVARSCRETFTPAQVLAEMKRRGTGYADTTIRTMVTGHMCRNALDNATITFDDLERIDHGVYRLVDDRHAADRPVR